MNSDENYEAHDALNATAALAYDIGVLKELRTNKMETAIELLESGVDSKVSRIARKLSKLDPSRQELLLQIFNQVKAYRDEYPRTPNKNVLEALPKENIDHIQVKAAEASKILGDLRT